MRTTLHITTKPITLACIPALNPPTGANSHSHRARKQESRHAPAALTSNLVQFDLSWLSLLPSLSSPLHEQWMHAKNVEQHSHRPDTQLQPPVCQYLLCVNNDKAAGWSPGAVAAQGEAASVSEKESNKCKRAYLCHGVAIVGQ